MDQMKGGNYPLFREQSSGRKPGLPHIHIATASSGESVMQNEDL